MALPKIEPIIFNRKIQPIVIIPAIDIPPSTQSFPIQSKIDEGVKNKEINKTKFITQPLNIASKAYVDNITGKLYIPTPPRYETYTVRDSIEAYNNRTGDYPCIKQTEIDISSFKVVHINLNTLTIDLPPKYPSTQ